MGTSAAKLHMYLPAEQAACIIDDVLNLLVLVLGLILWLVLLVDLQGRGQRQGVMGKGCMFAGYCCSLPPLPASGTAHLNDRMYVSESSCLRFAGSVQGSIHQGG